MKKILRKIEWQDILAPVTTALFFAFFMPFLILTTDIDYKNLINGGSLIGIVMLEIGYGLRMTIHRKVFQDVSFWRGCLVFLNLGAGSVLALAGIIFLILTAMEAGLKNSNSLYVLTAYPYALIYFIASFFLIFPRKKIREGVVAVKDGTLFYPGETMYVYPVRRYNIFSLEKICPISFSTRMRCRDGDVYVTIKGSVELDIERMRKENIRLFPFVENNKQWTDHVNVRFVMNVFMVSAERKTIAEIVTLPQEKAHFTVDNIPYVWNRETRLMLETQ